MGLELGHFRHSEQTGQSPLTLPYPEAITPDMLQHLQNVERRLEGKRGIFAFNAPANLYINSLRNNARAIDAGVPGRGRELRLTEEEAAYIDPSDDFMQQVGDLSALPTRMARQLNLNVYDRWVEAFAAYTVARRHSSSDDARVTKGVESIVDRLLHTTPLQLGMDPIVDQLHMLVAHGSSHDLPKERYASELRKLIGEYLGHTLLAA